MVQPSAARTARARATCGSGWPTSRAPAPTSRGHLEFEPAARPTPPLSKSNSRSSASCASGGTGLTPAFGRRRPRRLASGGPLNARRRPQPSPVGYDRPSRERHATVQAQQRHAKASRLPALTSQPTSSVTRASRGTATALCHAATHAQSVTPAVTRKRPSIRAHRLAAASVTRALRGTPQASR